MDFVNTRDFQWLNKYWEEQEYDTWNEQHLLENIHKIGNQLKNTLELDITLLDKEASSFFKKQMKRENTYKLMTSESEVYRMLND